MAKQMMSNTCDLLLVTVTETETDALWAIHAEHGGTTDSVYGDDNAYTSLGEIGGARVYHLQCRMGAMEPGASVQAVGEAVRELSPRFVVMVGIAFGIDQGNQPIGTVLLSEKLESYEQQRQGVTGLLKRGDKVTCNPYLLQVARMAARRVNVPFKAGLMVSGEKLIDNPRFRDELLRLCPGAIGGEMEGVGVYTGCKQTPWILVKGVCDFADGQKRVNKEENQRLAAKNAMKVIFHAILDGAFQLKANRSIPEWSSQKPLPDFRDERIRRLTQELDDLKTWRKSMKKAGDDTSELDEKILQKRREIRDRGATAGMKLLNDRFELQERIGKGGFAEVWKAWDEKTEQIVAVKIMHRSEAESSKRRDRFFRGARIMTNLKHEAIPRILLDRGEDEGFYFFAMEYFAGGDLNRYVLARGGLNLEETFTIIQRIGKALIQAHNQNIIHRDVKPANILLDERGHAFLTDFDLVRAGDTTGGTRTAGLGTFIFAAPEQNVDASDAAPSVDVYGLAMTMIFCLYGRPLTQVVLRHPEKVLSKLKISKLNQSVLEKGIEFELSFRYSSVAKFLDEFKAIDSVDQGEVIASRVIYRSAVVPERALRKVTVDHDLHFSIPVNDSVSLLMKYIPGGEFWMGSSPREIGRSDHEMRHLVYLSNSFWMSETPITQAIWEIVMGDNPSYFKGENKPVEQVSWEDVQLFIQALNKRASGQYRLPTEAEWEYACRARSETSYHFGHAINHSQVNFAGLHKQTRYAKGFQPNAWGLYQMHGNILEWCQDWFGEFPDGEVIDPAGPKTGVIRVLRGGSWSKRAAECRSAARDWGRPEYKSNDVGFRIVSDSKAF